MHCWRFDAVTEPTPTAPHTESDPMALLTQFLVAFGAAAGSAAV